MGSNVEQVYSYAMHPDIRVKLYALCNGREFIVFDVSKSEPLLYFPIPEINHFWLKLVGLLSSQAFHKIETTEIVQALFTQLELQRSDFMEREEFYKKHIAALNHRHLDNKSIPTIDEAVQQLAQSNIETAKVLFTKILEEKSVIARTAYREAATAARYLGALAFHSNTEEALTAYRRAVELDPDNPDGWSQLGYLLHYIGDLENASVAYEKAFKLGGSNA
jgi:Flp pilus assembly protein TadD